MSSNNKKILIDAICPDEIRTVLFHEGHAVEFDQETSERKQLKGNIYLATVKRIEPALQAVFLEYGGKKHGFLSFTEIPYECYQIPEDEKRKLIESRIAAAEEKEQSNDNNRKSEIDSITPEETVAISEEYEQKSKLSKKYRIQDVIKINQVIMVQVIKEERGNKGVSFSGYIALIGRHCILLPNSGQKSGVSKRIESTEVRQRMKEALNSIQLPKGFSLIIRSSGADQPLKEIEKDAAYLQSLWKKILNSSTPQGDFSIIYTEADIVQRTLRDLYSNEIKEVVVSGASCFEKAKEYAKFMGIAKSHIRMHKSSVPLLTYYNVESQITDLYSHMVKLPSGGYMVITPTEAMVSIDINSGRMTGEGSVEETAYRTNMEAAKEVARQINLRGLSGIIVIDFIDMIKDRYCRSVETAVKEAFKKDKAKVDIRKIGAFGLMVISRQRLKPSVIESNTTECSHCKGVGRVRSTESIAMTIMRELRIATVKATNGIFTLHVNSEIISHFFNNKRDVIREIEANANISLKVVADNSIESDKFSLKYTKNPDAPAERTAPSYGSNDTKKIEEKSSSDFIANNFSNNFWIQSWLVKLIDFIK